MGLLSGGIYRTTGMLGSALTWKIAAVAVMALGLAFVSVYWAGYQHARASFSKSLAKTEVKAAQKYVENVVSSEVAAAAVLEKEANRWRFFEEKVDQINKHYSEKPKRQSPPATVVQNEREKPNGKRNDQNEFLRPNRSEWKATTRVVEDPGPVVIFDADELRLYNAGNKGKDVNISPPQ